MTPEQIIKSWETLGHDNSKLYENDRILKKVYENNLKALYLNDETINIVISEFNKFAGKRIGEKTAEKISRAIEEVKPGITACINDNSIKVKIDREKAGYILSYDDSFIEICRVYDSNDRTYNYLFDGDGKFKQLESDKLIIWHKVNYIEDPKSYINQLQTAHKAIIEAADTYNKAIKAFREIAVNGLSEFDSIYVKQYLK